MIKAEKLSYSFPQKKLYDDITFTIEKGQHCAFIGASGSGKSTLISMIMYPEKYMFDGKLEVEAGNNISYISQFIEEQLHSSLSVYDYIAEIYIQLQSEIDDICNQLAAAEDVEALLEVYQQKLDEFEAYGGNDYEHVINNQLNMAGLANHKDLKVSELSGGEFKLVQIIKAMLVKPGVLIMDEPDVFLDFSNLNALKDLINSYNGTLIVVTHNRFLLDHCFNKILHLENMELNEFDGTFVEYNYALLEKKIELQELSLKDEEELLRNQELIDRYRYIATETADSAVGKQLKARVKIMERLEARKIKNPFVYVNEAEIDLSINNEIEETTAVKVNNYSAAYDKQILENVSFEIGSKDKVAIIGANGAGKTTLLRDIYKHQKDSIEVNEGIEMAYLSQDQSEILDESKTIMEEFIDYGFNTYDEVTEYVAGYGFKGEVLNQRIGKLSGGEKNILQLAKVCASNANMLLLDEPTSHLDMYTQIALERAIKNYNGAIMMISHEFYSIVNSMDYVLIVENKTVRKMSIRKFRKMVYDAYFDKDYLATEQLKKETEEKISLALKDKNFELAKKHLAELEQLIKN